MENTGKVRKKSCKNHYGERLSSSNLSFRDGFDPRNTKIDANTDSADYHDDFVILCPVIAENYAENDTSKISGCTNHT
jgi:hypothetical protein